MPFRLILSPTAQEQLSELERTDEEKLRKTRKCLGLLETNPRHPGLHSHRYEAYDVLFGEAVWESYLENNRPGAYRVFWTYGPTKDELSVHAIAPHP